MDRQMTIFEFLPQTANFCTMPEAEVMDIISQRIGVRLAYDKRLEEYSASVGKIKISAEISTYTCTHAGSQTIIEGRKFISCNWQGRIEGGGGPKDSIEDAVRFFQKVITEHCGRKKVIA